jgi:hypothetical protein
VLTFFHRFATEASFDGGVLEFSTDNGATWSTTDPTFIQGGYNGTLVGANPISGRNAWTGTTSGAFMETQVNLMAFAGQSVKFRFRFTTDGSGGVTGWWIDDVNTTIESPGGSVHFTDMLSPGDAIQGARLKRDGNPGTCAGPKAFPGTVATAVAYDLFGVLNRDSEQACLTATTKDNTGCALFTSAYSPSFNPGDISANYVSDSGSSTNDTGGGSTTASFPVGVGARLLTQVAGTQSAFCLSPGYDITLSFVPPHTTFTSGPSGTTTNKSARFDFTSSAANSTFECAFDAGSFSGCTSPQTFNNLVLGQHTLQVRATDPNGATESPAAARTFTVAQAPVPDTTPPTVSNYAMNPTAILPFTSGGSIAAKKGATVSYTVSEAGTATFTVERSTPGKKVKGKCVKPTKKNRKAKNCTRYSTLAGSFSRASAAGANSFTFTGRLNGLALRPGSYRLVMVAKDAAGNASAPVRKAFRIVKPKKKKKK